MTVPWELLTRLVVGTVLGGIIGYERDIHGRVAGFRTHLIVALASTTFMLVSTHFVYYQHYGRDDLVSVDPSRIASSVVTGIGFLGGGAILRTGVTVQGLTTAAGLWLVAAIGLSAGAGMYVVSVVATLLGVFALAALRRLERKDDSRLHRRISLVLSEGGPSVPALVAVLAEAGVVVSPAEYERHADERRVRVTLRAQIPVADGDRLVRLLESQPGLESVRIEPIA